jgi:hypothetical protein
MNERTKLIFALMQVENLTSLIKDNEYESYMISQLIPFKVELERQLTNLNESVKVKE